MKKCYLLRATFLQKTRFERDDQGLWDGMSAAGASDHDRIAIVNKAYRFFKGYDSHVVYVAWRTTAPLPFLTSLTDWASGRALKYGSSG